jgi:hypothetical protein
VGTGLSAYKNVAEAAQKRTSGRSLMRFARPAITSLESRRSFMSNNTDLLSLESKCA